MDAEVTLILRNRDASKAIDALGKIWTSGNLQSTYAATHFNNAITPVNIFSFGYTSTDVLLLARMTNNHLILNLENTINPNDSGQLKARVNNYYNHVRNGFKIHGIKIESSKAIITIAGLQIPGEIKTGLQELKEDLKDKRDKIFIEPISALAISFFALRFGFVEIKDYDKDVTKILIAMAEVYLGIIIVYIGKFLFKKSGKKFNFKLEL